MPEAVIVCTGSVSQHHYALCPFSHTRLTLTPLIRADAVQGWVSACQARGIPCNDHFRLQAVLGDPVKVGSRGRGASTGSERPGGPRQ